MTRIMTALPLSVVMAVALAVSLNAQAKPEKQGLPYTLQTAEDHMRVLDLSRVVSGTPQRGTFCIGGTDTHVYNLGFLARNTHIRVEFTSTGDPVATLIRYRTGMEAPNNLFQGNFVSNDDGGGNLEPLINTRMVWDGSATLLVSGFGEGFFCYYFNVVLS